MEKVRAFVSLHQNGNLEQINNTQGFCLHSSCFEKQKGSLVKTIKKQENSLETYRLRDLPKKCKLSFINNEVKNPTIKTVHNETVELRLQPCQLHNQRAVGKK